MQTNKFKLSKLAQIYFLKIKSYTIIKSFESQPNCYRDNLLTAFQMLAEDPAVGRSCDDLYPSGFYFPVGKHTAYFTKKMAFSVLVNRNYYRLI